jgi:hypothetical protein
MTLDKDARAAGISSARRGPRPLTDPLTMRAIAHPTRLALLEALALHQPLTATEATEAAEAIGETPTNCSFHLRMLAKYGFVEEAGEAPGRRRPWRLTQIGFTHGGMADDAESAHASEAPARLLWDHWLDRIETIKARKSRFEASWAQVTSGTENLVYVTPDEAEQLIADTRVLLDRYRDRLEDPGLRPAGSLPVEAVLFTFPLEATKADDGLS